MNLVLSETSLDAAYGLLPWLAVEARVGLRVVDVTPKYFELDYTPKNVPNDIHHKNETIVGPTDPWLVLRAGAAHGRLVTAARIGVTLPLGSTVPDPYVLGAAGKPHEHIQLGTGTLVPIVGGAVAYLTSRAEVSLSALAFFSLYENGEGFRAPSRWFASVRTTFPFAAAALRPYIAADLVHEGREQWHGTPGSESYVRTELLIGGGVAWEFAAPWSLDAGFRARALRFTDGASLDYPGLLQLGLSTHFGGR